MARVGCLDSRPSYGLWRSLVSASVWGTEGPGFESRQPDHQNLRSADRRWLRRHRKRSYTIFEGTSEIQRLVIARAVSGVRIA